MSIIDRLDRRFGRHAVGGLVTYLIAVQVALYILQFFRLDQQFANDSIRELIELVPEKVLEGEVWRLVTFMFEAPVTHPIWAFFYWYLLHLFATTLEQRWGPFRLNLYLLVGWAATVLVAMLVPQLRQTEVTNGYLYTSVFLAFAQLYPDFELRLFFVLPVKVKWLALLTWIGFVQSVVIGGWPAFWIAAATTADFLLFLGSDVWRSARHWRRGHQFQRRVQQGQAARAAFFHECSVCGLNSKEAPRVQFRYCSQCDDQRCYCPEHLQSHEHLRGER